MTSRLRNRIHDIISSKKNACEHVYFESIFRKKLESLEQQNVNSNKLFMVELQSQVSILSAF